MQVAGLLAPLATLYNIYTSTHDRPMSFVVIETNSVQQGMSHFTKASSNNIKNNFHGMYTKSYLVMTSQGLHIVIGFVAIYSKYDTIRKLNLLLRYQQISLSIESTI